MSSSSFGEDESAEVSPNPSLSVSRSSGNTPEVGAHAKSHVAAMSLNIMSNKSTFSKPFSRHFAALGTSYNFEYFY